MIGMKPGGAPRVSGRPRSYRVKQQKSLPHAVRSSFSVSLPYTGLRASEKSYAGLPVARKRAKALMAWILPGDLQTGGVSRKIPGSVLQGGLGHTMKHTDELQKLTEGHDILAIARGNRLI